MGRFDDAVGFAMSTWFGTDMTETIDYNGTDIQGHVVEYGRAEEDRVVYDYVDIEVDNTDMSEITFRTDTVVIDSVTWRYPKKLKGDPYASVFRFRRNERPLLK